MNQIQNDTEHVEDIEDIAVLLRRYAREAYRQYKVGERIRFSVQFGHFPNPQNNGIPQFAWLLLTCVEGILFQPNVGRWIIQMSYFWRPVPTREEIIQQVLNALEGVRIELSRQKLAQDGPSMPLHRPPSPPPPPPFGIGAN